MRVLPRLLAALALALAWTGATMIQPSWACGCGAMITRGSMTVAQETSIVRFDQASATEQIVMRLSVRSDATDAAWLFPTPSAARVELGDRSWFDQLDTLTEPRVVTRHTWWGPLFTGPGKGPVVGAAAPRPGGVSVLSEQRLGPFQVATLSSGDSGALTGWLSAHGYTLSPRLAEGLRPYVSRGWKYVAIKLTPGSGTRLNGDLDPLHITFHSTEPIYPMRLSRLAKTSQSLRLYLLGDHRLNPAAGPLPQEGVTYAGWVAPAQVSSPGLRTFLGGRTFLTERVDGYLPPGSITDDIHLAYGPDTTYQEVDYRTEVVRFLGIPAGWAAIFGALLLAAAATGATLTVRLRRHRPVRP